MNKLDIIKCEACGRNPSRCYCRMTTLEEINERWAKESTLEKCDECASEIIPCFCYSYENISARTKIETANKLNFCNCNPKWTWKSDGTCAMCGGIR